MTRREHAAVLAGLRLLQNALDHEEALRADPVWDVLTCGEELTPLSIAEINDLCERLNTSRRAT